MCGFRYTTALYCCNGQASYHVYKPHATVWPQHLQCCDPAIAASPRATTRHDARSPRQHNQCAAFATLQLYIAVTAKTCSLPNVCGSRLHIQVRHTATHQVRHMATHSFITLSRQRPAVSRKLQAMHSHHAAARQCVHDTSPCFNSKAPAEPSTQTVPGTKLARAPSSAGSPPRSPPKTLPTVFPTVASERLLRALLLGVA